MSRNGTRQQRKKKNYFMRSWDLQKLKFYVGFVLVIVVMISMFSCDSYKYGEGVTRDTQRTFNKNKQYLYSIVFDAIMVEKMYCPNCDINKYALKMIIKDISEKPFIENSQYPPYYSFEGDSILILSVSKELYEKVNVNQKILKTYNSYDLFINNEKYNLLNKKDNAWLP